MKRFFAFLELMVLAIFPVAFLFSASFVQAAPTCWCSINQECEKHTEKEAVSSKEACPKFCFDKKGSALNYDEADFGERTGAYCLLPGGEPPHCWCLGPNKCEHHTTYNDDKSMPFTCAKDDESPSCQGFCKAKGEGWRAIHCDDKYYNQEELDAECAKAVGKTGPITKTVKNEKPGPIALSVEIGGKKSVGSLQEYIVAAYKYAIGVSVIAAIVMVVYGGFRYLLGSAVGSADKGKKIIFDATMGMIIVLGAWLILNTVNPATLTLQVRGLTNVNAIPDTAEIKVGSICYADKDCGDKENGVACMLFDKSQGLCSDGSEGTMCGCRWPDGCRDDAYLNNGGKEYKSCQSGLACLIVFSSQDRIGTQRCMKAFETPNPIVNEGKSCKNDAECEDGSCVLVSIDPDAGDLAWKGFCSSGKEGQRCRCSVEGCMSMTDEANNSTNAGGTGIVNCEPGLTCVVSNKTFRSSPINQRGFFGTVLDGDWYCQKSPAEK